MTNVIQKLVQAKKFFYRFPRLFTKILEFKISCRLNFGATELGLPEPKLKKKIRIRHQQIVQITLKKNFFDNNFFTLRVLVRPHTLRTKLKDISVKIKISTKTMRTRTKERSSFHINTFCVYSQYFVKVDSKFNNLLNFMRQNFIKCSKFQRQNTLTEISFNFVRRVYGLTKTRRVKKLLSKIFF